MPATITPTGTTLQIATDEAFSTIINTDDSGTYRTSQAFAAGDLPYGQDLFARVKHTSAETGDSAWSSTVKFSIIIPANIIGVCLDNSVASTKGTFYWIDALGNRLTEFDASQHPLFNGITMATTDTGRGYPVTLTKFPKGYIKTATSGPAGSFSDGKKCWWISDLPETGFRPALCFKRSTATGSDSKYIISDYEYMGTYLAHSETVGGKTCLGSKKGKAVLHSQKKATFKTYAANRNNSGAGETGYALFDIYDLAWLRLLSLIQKCGTSTQTDWGDNSSGTSGPATGSTNARMVFKGTQSAPEVMMEDLWRCFWYHVDLISISSGRVTLTSPMDQTSALAFGDSNTARYTQPTTSGWIRDVLDCPFTVGNDTHDLMELFLPKTVVSAENQGTWSDYYTYASGNPVYGGDHSTGTQAGLYASSFLTDTYTTSSQQGTHGEPTAYCGLVYYCCDLCTSSETSWRYDISTGLGRSAIRYNYSGSYSFRDVGCSNAFHTHSHPSSLYIHYYSCVAPCAHSGNNPGCPRGWKSYSAYRYYQPGCFSGSYYPDARMETITTTHYRATLAARIRKS